MHQTIDYRRYGSPYPKGDYESALRALRLLREAIMLIPEGSFIERDEALADIEAYIYSHVLPDEARDYDRM